MQVRLKISLRFDGFLYNLVLYVYLQFSRTAMTKCIRFNYEYLCVDEEWNLIDLVG